MTGRSHGQGKGKGSRSLLLGRGAHQQGPVAGLDGDRGNLATPVCCRSPTSLPTTQRTVRLGLRIS